MKRPEDVEMRVRKGLESLLEISRSNVDTFSGRLVKLLEQQAKMAAEIADARAGLVAAEWTATQVEKLLQSEDLTADEGEG